VPPADDHAGVLQPEAPPGLGATSGEARRGQPPEVPWATLAVISAGGVLGALAREGLWAVFAHRYGAGDWSTWGINVAGCALIGALMTWLTEVRPGHRHARPFLGIGVLGGFTTFSTYTVDIQRALVTGAPQAALGYLAATLGAGLAATYAGIKLVRLAVRPHRKER
jgi:CrcB protein